MIYITKEGEYFLDEHPEAYEPNQSKIKKAISLVGTEDVKNMELIGTILYFAKLSNRDSEVEDLVNIVKPHFLRATIKESIKYLKDEKVLPVTR